MQELRSLYVCYLSLDDPLVHTQVLSYLGGLAKRGHELHLLTYETGRLGWRRRRRLRTQLAARGIAWHGLRYHRRPSLPATVWDALVGAAYGAWLVRRHRLAAVHARSHVPAAMALIIAPLTGARVIFDIRGLMAEEYVDAGRWPAGGIAYRLTKHVEGLAIGRAAGIIVLTERVRRLLFGADPEANPRVRVIPCCVDVDAFARTRDLREAMRERLGLADRRILVYVGKFTGWYMEREMAEFFAAAREIEPRLHFLILTQSDPEPIERELARAGVGPGEYTIGRVAAAELPAHLAAADAAVCFIRRLPSKISSSPTKVGEYLAAGLPMACSAGIGDVDDLLGEDGAGVAVDTYDGGSYTHAATRLMALMSDPAAPERARRLARQALSLTEVGIPGYDALYRHVAGQGRKRAV